MQLVLVELINGKCKKTALEAVAFAAKMGETTALALGTASADTLQALGAYGIGKVLHINNEKLNQVYSKAYTKAIAAAATHVGADTVILSHNSTGRMVAPRVAVRMEAALFAGVNELPGNDTIRKAVFSGKAFADLQMSTGKKVISLNPNSYKAVAGTGTASVESFSVDFADSDFDYAITGVEDEAGGHVPLPEAEIVVSGGRGLKGPEHWGIVEDLAKALGAATACSRPVADIGWRPHHEHVGQTGITIKPTLYIAVGISGAIQHLAGVNQSKVIVVINKDPEAPFFKAADYGIVGDAFEVLPRITEAVKKLHAGA
ncbi:MAG TPA: electron transfer flavoprotein subunit alpha/FixB family protein [Chitinophagales bacterium]|nr:electron transfer flavoprotein subunit alpha/FixB family protein [Chitinophagales bacterium]HMZ87996.1 electron transfer flavoprotein subunit alpha/FixB family protein [Chitinophagales bacterium]HNE46213.1 electron transfer flavoprotein subunit alpha/FixB family protein [Chitinophagales bacterium]HNI54079.1 electron transfer flavoprotein subunit alpha/FixB family protein [Chitinophagales bacterium]HNK97740.1 electron transfer flavoprotein subunit alpha/FixB family protein [Chitinophagales ba